MAGFSMGGASAWSYIVHYADRWAAAAPGAGFTETRDFLRGELARQPQNAVQQTLWHLYDATDYAVNAFNLPVVAYSGANDGQKQAADAMAAAMPPEGLTLEHIIGPNTGHAYEPGARQQIQDRLDQFASRGRNPVPKEVRFTTWTLRYNKMFWIAVEGIEQHWQRARVQRGDRRRRAFARRRRSHRDARRVRQGPGAVRCRRATRAFKSTARQLDAAASHAATGRSTSGWSK